MDATKTHLQSWQGCQPSEYYDSTRIYVFVPLWINLLVLLLWWTSKPESLQLKVTLSGRIETEL